MADDYVFRHHWGDWGVSPFFSYAPGFFFGEDPPKPDKGVTVDNSPADGYFVYRNRNGKSEYLHKNGTWHKQCGAANFYASEREATVAAVLAGMESPEVKELKAANETAQKRLAEKQKVVEQVCKERDGARAARDGAVSRADALAAEVAKLKGDLAQNWGDARKLDECERIAKGEPVNVLHFSNAVDAVRKLRADYEYEKKRADDFVSAVGRNGPLLAAIRQVAEGGPCPWAGPKSDTLDAVKAMRNHLQACEKIAKGDGAMWNGDSPAVDAVLKLRQRYTKAKEALA